jgi:hypothetical protein
MSQSAPKPATAANAAKASGVPVEQAAVKKAAAGSNGTTAKKAAARTNGTKPAAAKKVAQKKAPAAKKAPAPVAKKAPAARKAVPAPAPVVEPPPVVIEPVEQRRSWFSRRPLAFTAPDWASGWYEQGRRLSRSRTAVVVILSSLGLAAAAGYGTHLMYADPEPVAASPPDVTCWNGSLAPAADCTLPSGVAGLEWVFQSFDRADDGCVDVLVEHPEYKRPTMWRCSETFGGRTVEITYSELTSVASGLAYHRDLFSGAKLSAFADPDGKVDRYVWREPEPVDGIFRLGAMYVDFPYAVLVEATTLRDRDRTYRDVVRSRDPKHLTTRYE